MTTKNHDDSLVGRRYDVYKLRKRSKSKAHLYHSFVQQCKELYDKDIAN